MYATQNLTIRQQVALETLRHFWFSFRQAQHHLENLPEDCPEEAIGAAGTMYDVTRNAVFPAVALFLSELLEQPYMETVDVLAEMEPGNPDIQPVDERFRGFLRDAALSMGLVDA